MDIFFNGKMLPPEQATLSILDPGFQHAIGLFETFNVHNATPFKLKEHLQRLQKSAKILGLAPDLNTDALAQAVQITIHHNNIQQARLRLTISPGLATKQAEKIQPTITIVPTPITDYDPAYFIQGVDIIFAHALANPFDPTAGHKTLNYWPRLRTLKQAATTGASEAIILNISNHIASGCISNIFHVKDKTLYTPYAQGQEAKDALPAPVLPGIIRQTILQIAKDMNIPTKQKMITPQEIQNADEVFLTNSSWYVLPVKKIENTNIANAKPGPITQQLRDGLLDIIQAQTTQP